MSYGIITWVALGIRLLVGIARMGHRPFRNGPARQPSRPRSAVNCSISWTVAPAIILAY
jgi:hypothetical protein